MEWYFQCYVRLLDSNHCSTSTIILLVGFGGLRRGYVRIGSLHMYPKCFVVMLSFPVAFVNTVQQCGYFALAGQR